MTKKFIILATDDRSGLPSVKLRPGELIDLWKGDNETPHEMRVTAISHISRFGGLYATLESTTTSLGFQAPIAPMRLLERED